MKAEYVPFSKIIEADANEHFHVPKYQREYSWGRKEWDQLWDDITDNAPDYFMGSLICVNNKATFSVGDETIFQVVDGQQRLTTLSLLLLALYKKLVSANTGHEYEDETERKHVNNCLASLERKLVKHKKYPKPAEPGALQIGKHTYFLRVQPSAQNQNLEDYLYLLSEAQLFGPQPKPRLCGNRRMALALSYFQSELTDKVEDLCALFEKINRLQFVMITVGSQADAFTLFEALNNRGVPLNAIDIIKNKMLAELERAHPGSIDESFERWQKIVGALQDVSEQERFLRHYYNAFKHLPTVRVDRVSRATKSQVISVYEELIEKRDPEVIFKDLTSKAETYGKLLRPADDFTVQERFGLTELQRIGATPAYQLLLYLFSLPRNCLQPIDFRERALDLLEKYYVRRNVTDLPPTRDLDLANIEIIESCAKLLEQKQSLSISDFTAFVMNGRSKPATLEQFRTALSGGIYDENLAMARYLLIRLDLLHHTREYNPDLWLRDDKDRFVWTVEHVLPQKVPLPEHWAKMIAPLNGDLKRASEIQEQVVDSIGNLTLSAYNPNLATSSLTKKQELAEARVLPNEKIHIGYRNGLALNNLPFQFDGKTTTLATADVWNAGTITERGRVMIDLIVNANKLPGE